MDVQLCEKKNVSQCNGTRILPETISSRSLASTLNLTCANDVTCSYDVIMRKRQVLNLTLTLRVPRISLRP